MSDNSFSIAVLPGDAIGPEIVAQAVRVFPVLEKWRDLSFKLTSSPFGASAYFTHGKAFPVETMRVCDAADAILKGPVGLSHAESQQIPVEEQPERGAILPLRARYDTYANLRPVYLPRDMAHFSPLRPEIIRDGIDILMVRELVGGLYFGSKERGRNQAGHRYVRESLEYDEEQISRILKVAFQQASQRKRVLHNIHKSNVLMSSVLWNEILEEVRQEYPDVEVRHQLVDSAATALCLDPGQFDVMVMENMFGDILSDQGGGLLGSLGLMPSACAGPDKAYYEPAHGSAPDIAGRGIANPYSMFGSVAMLLEISCGLHREAASLRQAMQQVFAEGYTTADLPGPADSTVIINTEAFGDRVIANFESSLKGDQSD